ncbi:GyrI-like domain-containing protein [Ornithinimicrobium sp. W1679]|uniref:GyrI-like domain-containing protein n=1 Tax=unclassified Ornithinimicrobium TaxID=2615080 RepID=UPI003CF49FA8
MSTVPELATLQPTTVAVVRDTVRMRELPDFFGRVFHAVMTVAMDEDVEITGPPFAQYFGVPDEAVEVAAGFPTARPVTPSHGVTASELPGGRVAQLLHEGSYDGLPDAYRRLMSWMDDQGLRPGEVMWESYLTEPPADAGETARTLISWRVAD